MTLYPGTEDWTRNVPRIFDNNWTNYTGSKVVFHHDHLPGEVIEQKIWKAYLTFYNPLRRWDLVLKNVAGVNPRRLYRILKTLRKQRDNVVPEMDPVDAYISLQTDSWESWRRANTSEVPARVAAAVWPLGSRDNDKRRVLGRAPALTLSQEEKS